MFLVISILSRRRWDVDVVLIYVFLISWELEIWESDSWMPDPTVLLRSGESGVVVSEVTDAATYSPRNCRPVGQLCGCLTPTAVSFWYLRQKWWKFSVKIHLHFYSHQYLMLIFFSLNVTLFDTKQRNLYSNSNYCQRIFKHSYTHNNIKFQGIFD